MECGCGNKISVVRREGDVPYFITRNLGKVGDSLPCADGIKVDVADWFPVRLFILAAHRHDFSVAGKGDVRIIVHGGVPRSLNLQLPFQFPLPNVPAMEKMAEFGSEYVLPVRQKQDLGERTAALGRPHFFYDIPRSEIPDEDVAVPVAGDHITAVRRKSNGVYGRIDEGGANLFPQSNIQQF